MSTHRFKAPSTIHLFLTQSRREKKEDRGEEEEVLGEKRERSRWCHTAQCLQSPSFLTPPPTSLPVNTPTPRRGTAAKDNETGASRALPEEGKTRVSAIVVTPGTSPRPRWLAGGQVVVVAEGGEGGRGSAYNSLPCCLPPNPALPHTLASLTPSGSSRQPDFLTLAFSASLVHPPPPTHCSPFPPLLPPPFHCI